MIISIISAVPFLSPKYVVFYCRVLKGVLQVRLWLSSIMVAKSAFDSEPTSARISHWQSSILRLFEHTHSCAVDFDQPESLTAIKLAEWTCRMDLTIIFADDAEKVTVTVSR